MERRNPNDTTNAGDSRPRRVSMGSGLAAALIVAACLAILPASQAWANPSLTEQGFKYRVAMTVSNSFIEANLGDWTLVFDQSFTNLLTSANGPLDSGGTRPARSDGGDIRFSSDAAGTTRLACDLRTFTTAAASGDRKLEIAVKIPAVSSITNTTIYLWWGHAGARRALPDTLYGQYNAYDPYFELVVPDGGGTNRTRRAYSGTGESGVPMGTATGKVGYATEFNGTSHAVTFGNVLDLGLSNRTYHGWFKLSTTTISVYAFFLSKTDSTGTPYRHALGITSSGKLSAIFKGASNTDYTSEESLPSFDTAWHHFSYVIARAGSYTASVDLSPVATRDISAEVSNSFAINRPFRLGSYTSHTTGNPMYVFPGRLDEIRVSSVARAAAWLKAEYHNQSNTPGFLNWGAIEDVATVAPPSLTRCRFRYRLPLTVTPTHVDDDLTDWTLVFDQSFTNLLTSDNGPLDADGDRPAQSDGRDIRFSADKEGAERLACDIREFSTAATPVNGTMELAVRIPSVSASSGATIYMWWGNATATLPAPDDIFGQYNAYDERFLLVTPDGGTNRTSVALTATGEGGVVFGGDAGKVGRTTVFDGSNDAITFGNVLDLGLSNRTYHGWFKLSTTSLSSERYLLSKADISTAEYRHALGITTAGHLVAVFKGKSNVDYNSTNAYSSFDTEWHHFSYVIARAGSYTASVDLLQVATRNISAQVNNSFAINRHFRLGSYTLLTGGPTLFFPGRLDEIRVSSVVRAAAWLKAEYHNQSNTPGFLNWGAIETPAMKGTMLLLN